MPSRALPWIRSCVALLAITSLAVFLRFTRAEEKFNPKVVIPRAFPAITEAPMMSAEKAAQDLQDNEIVLGVVVNGRARAYPINMLTGPQREIINDTLGGRAIAATW